jgi:hypothetical protein
MSDIPGGRESDQREVMQMMAQFDVPAYARRARNMEQALEHLLERCRRKRNEWLMMARLRLGQLAVLTGEWSALEAMLDDEQIARLRQLHAELEPKLRVPLTATTSVRVLRRALVDFIQSAERFNRRWSAYLAKVDLAHVNALRDGYNRFYVLEKECALRNSAVARLGFQHMPPLTSADLERLLPPLFVPQPCTKG